MGRAITPAFRVETRDMIGVGEKAPDCPLWVDVGPGTVDTMGNFTSPSFVGRWECRRNALRAGSHAYDGNTRLSHETVPDAIFGRRSFDDVTLPALTIVGTVYIKRHSKHIPSYLVTV